MHDYKARILLIMPDFFNYPKAITEELNNMGFDVDFFNDRPSNNGIIKAILRINRNLVNSYVNRYFKKILAEVRKKRYDIVFLISGQSLSFSEDMLKDLKKEQPNAIYILYQWDSIKNFPYILEMQKFFDVCFTFDREDSYKNKQLEFLPLFYTKPFEMIGINKPNNFQFDCSYVGTAHPQKFKYINDISHALRNIMPKQYIYHYMPSILKYIYHKVTAPEYKKAKIKDFKFTKVSNKQMIDIYYNSKCILDSPQSGQTGLTMRTFECLGAKRKLITTNPDVKNYDFYRESNILVYDGKIDIDSVFFKNDYEELPVETYNRYSLRNWLTNILKTGLKKGGLDYENFSNRC